MGPRINQIEARARENLRGQRHRAPRFVRVVQTAERFQRPVVQRLHADRNAVDAGRAVIAKAFLLDAVGIGLQRDLGVGRDGPVRRDRLDHDADRAPTSQRRRATAEKNGGDGG